MQQRARCTSLMSQTGRRALHLITTTQRRGAEVLASQLAPQLDQLGCPSSIVALVAAEGGLPVPALGTRRLAPGTLAALRRRMRTADVTIAHGSTTLPAAVLARSGRRSRLVYRSVGDPRFWAPKGLRRARTGFLMRQADRVVALTDEAADVLVDHYGIGRDRIRVVPKGVSDLRAGAETPSRGEARRALGLSPGVTVVLCLGALSTEKNVALAVEAIGRMPGVVLVVAGDGPDRRSLEALAAARAPGRVVFTGSVADPGPVLRAADALVLTSVTEGMPGVVIEAGFAGLPVVATRVGWVDRIVQDGQTGVLVPSGDPGAVADGLAAVLADGVGAAMGARAREYCLRHFEMEVVARRWAALLDELAAGT